MLLVKRIIVITYAKNCQKNKFKLVEVIQEKLDSFFQTRCIKLVLSNERTQTNHRL